MAEELNTDKKEFGPRTAVEVDRIDQLLGFTKKLLPRTNIRRKIWSKN
jgi:hypothetical protein